ncbi:MAG: Ca-activated chloride channel family protein [Halieaceae bacterium]|jgi:Ca-activated chloride channel family protein
MAEWLGGFYQLHFLRPWCLLFLLMAAFYLIWLWRYGASQQDWTRMISPHLYKALLVQDRSRIFFNPRTIVTLLAVVISVALAGPTWERQPSPFAEDKAALVICLDLSESMNQKDVQPSRLERAKLKIRDLLDLRSGSLTGLVVFSGSAHTVIPLTSDRDILENFVDSVETAMMPRTGKLPGAALDLADNMLSSSPIPGTVMLMTDGISSDAIKEFSDYFAEQRHQLLVLGVGLSGSAEGEDEGYLPLQEAGLQDLASAAGGGYRALTLDDSDVRQLNRSINYHLAIMQGEDGAVPWKDAGYYLVFAVALLLLPWFRRGWTLQFGLAMLLLGGSLGSHNARADNDFVDLWLTSDQQGRWYFERGEFERAAQVFSDSSWKAVAYYHAENFNAAADIFLQLNNAVAYMHAGNAFAHGQRYLDALDAYDESLRLRPNHAGSLANRRRVQELVDAINRMSESQQSEPGEAVERSEELGDEPRRAEGAQRETFDKEQTQTLSAEEILANEAINALWMREVQPNPARFLKIKFRMQLDRTRTREARDGN